MKTQDFHFDLPEELIAKYPLENRSDSRLLVYRRDSGTHSHEQFKSLVHLLNPGDLLVMNNSKVIPARFYGQKQSGGRVEFLLERKIDKQNFYAHIRASKSPKTGSIIRLEKGFRVEIMGREGSLYHVQANSYLDEILESIGHIPLPPYMNRSDELSDKQRYQTVYAQHQGSVAAPTAGLHFDTIIMDELIKKGINIAYVTLHIGAGTFQPVRVDNIQEHSMHSEYFEISQDLCDLVKQTKAANNRVVAVGTTAMRSLESAAKDGTLKAFKGDTDIFIYPGYQFKVCDGLLTNFHLPESTLLMLVSAFIGHKEAMQLYQIAIQERYRFYSYGDASLLF